MQESKKNSFVMYTDYAEHIKLLSMEQRGCLFTAIIAYASETELPEMDGMTQMAFSFIKAQMNRDIEKYQETVEKRREAGKLGGRPKANGFSDKAKKANGFSEKQMKAKKPDTDNVNDNDTDNDLKDISAPVDSCESPCAGKFLLNDQTEYMISENDVETFQQLYPGIDVRQELRTIEAWCLSNQKNRKTRNGAKRFLNAWLSRAQNSARPEKKPAPKKNSFSNYPQRSYNYDELERQLLNSQ